jgi:P2-related tail formation protein
MSDLSFEQLENMKKADLVSHAKDLGMKRLSGLKNADIRLAIFNFDPAAPVPQRQKACDEDQELNPFTGGCRKACDSETHYRHPDTHRCRKIVNDDQAARYAKKQETLRVRMATACEQEGQVRNPDTGRCRQVCADNKYRDLDTGKCRTWVDPIYENSTVAEKRLARLQKLLTKKQEKLRVRMSTACEKDYQERNEQGHCVGTRPKIKAGGGDYTPASTLLGTTNTVLDIVTDYLEDFKGEMQVSKRLRDQGHTRLVQKLSRMPMEELRRQAKSKETNHLIQSILSTNADTLVRLYLVQNTNTSAETLHNMSTDTDISVRRSVAENKNTSAETLTVLSMDSEPIVRHKVAENECTSAETLNALSMDIESVREEVAMNKNTRAKTLHTMSTDTYNRIRFLIASHDNTSAETLTVLSMDSVPIVRHKVTCHANTSAETLTVLSMDSDVQVRDNAIDDNGEIMRCADAEYDEG